MVDLKSGLDDGSMYLGAGVFLPSADAVEILSYHLDWLVVDLEHGPIDVVNLPDMVRAAECWDTAVLVRIADTDYGEVDRILDAGADGIVYPHIRTAEDAERAVETTFFPPKGDRGVGYGRALRYGQQKTETALNANGGVLCAIQIEDEAGVENAESIIAVDGVDAVFVGPNDLAASKHAFEEALSDGYEFAVDGDVEHVADVAAAHDVTFGYPAADIASVERITELGGQLVLTKFGASFLNDAVASVATEFEQHLE